MTVDTSTGVNLTVFNDLLKEFYIGPIRDQLNSKTILLHRITKNEEDISGRIAVVPLRLGRNEGHSAIAEGGFLADPLSNSYDRAEIPMRFQYGRILVNGPTIAASRNERGAFTQAIESEIYNLVTDMKNELNRQLFGNGAGRLCTVTAFVAGPPDTYTVNNPYGIGALNQGAGTRFIRGPVTAGTGMVIGVFSAGGVFRGSGQVATVTAPSTFTVTTSIAGVIAGDFIVRASRVGLTAAGTDALSHAAMREMMGLLGIINNADPPSGALENVASTVATWQATVLDNTTVARPLDLDLMQQAIDAVDIAGDGVPTLIITTHALHRKYQGLLTANKRYVNTMELDGGFRALEYDEIPIVYDKDAPNNRMFFVDEDTLAVYRMSDYFWLDKDGSVLRRLDDKDAYQATLALYAELGTSSRNRHAIINDLDES